MAKNLKTKLKRRGRPRKHVSGNRSKTEAAPAAETEKNQSLPTGTNAPSAIENSSEGESAFEKIVAESKARIAEAAPIERNSKRGRGRPRGSARPRSAEVSSTAAPVDGVAQAPQATATPELAPHLVVPIQALSIIPARKYGVAELAFTQDEASAISISLDNAIRAWFPTVETMDPRFAALGMLGLTVGTIGFQKFQIYSEVKSRREPPAPVAPPTEVQPSETRPPVAEDELFPVSAANFFRKEVSQ